MMQRSVWLSRFGLVAAVALGPACQSDDSSPTPVQADGSADPGVPDVTSDGETAQADADGSGATPTLCVPVPPPEAMLQAGERDEAGAVMSPGGQGLVSLGITTELPGFPARAVASADGAVAWVLSTSNDDRRVLVLNGRTGALLQNVELPEALQGLVVDDVNRRLYVSGGSAERLYTFPLADDGTLRVEERIDTVLPGYVSALALSADGAALYVGSLAPPQVYVVDTTALQGETSPLRSTWRVSRPVWDMRLLEQRGELVVSSLESDGVQFVSVGDGTLSDIVEIGSTTSGLAVSADEETLWVVSSGTDEVVELNLADRSVSRRLVVHEQDLTTADGRTLGRTNPNSVTLSPDESRLYVTRSSDNAVSVLDRAEGTLLGAFPTTWHPTSTLFLGDGDTVLVTEGKGFGSGPNEGRRSMDQLDGAATLVELATIDLAETSAQVLANAQRAREVFPFDCDGFFPIPTRPDQVSPIEHVILVVKENKTFDCVFGDLQDMDVDVDPTLVRWGQDVTPNQHQLARDFTISDNFYDEVEDSDMGHILLTSGYLSVYAERVWMEAQRTGRFLGFQTNAEYIGPEDNLFTHLLDNGVSVQVYGEIVGMTALSAAGEEVSLYTDPNYPGGPFYSMGARDTDRAQYVLDEIEAGRFAQFTYMLMPNDHTGGVTPGNPTPEAQVADNDYAVGLLVEGLSRSPYWEKTAIIVVEDDPQGCEDHVDSHRSFVLVMSPWARRGYVSHVNANYQSVFATITRILGVPPMGRPDASASPLWDMFTATADLSPWTAVPRTVPESKINDLTTPGVRESLRMDFRGPDRNEDLGVVLDAYRLWRMGQLSAEQAQARIDAGLRTLAARGTLQGEALDERREELEEEATEERFSFDAALDGYREFVTRQGLSIDTTVYGGPLSEAEIEDVMQGRTPLTTFDRFGATVSRPRVTLPPARLRPGSAPRVP
jgi:DNA-binding beta-propeller fold protein YncE